MVARRLLLLSAGALLLPVRGFAGPTPAPKDASLYFITPRDGQRVKSPVYCRFGLSGMGVTHAGDAYANSGHHHLLVDVKDPLDPNEPIPSDRNHLHFGAGQTEAKVQLARGPHTLQLVLGDSAHIPFNPPVVSKKIRITVI
ncbi:MAG TPA: DUF4399 domain-containing protein [Stellaceae bacterium]|nr:DUF4399 domain-containing protein [Stellaceae bacterium]